MHHLLSDQENVQETSCQRLEQNCNYNNEHCLSFKFFHQKCLGINDYIADGFSLCRGFAEFPNLEDLSEGCVPQNEKFEIVKIDPQHDEKLLRLVSVIFDRIQEQDDTFARAKIIAQLTFDSLGGKVENKDQLENVYWKQIAKSLSSVTTLLGDLTVGLSVHRSVLFKFLSDVFLICVRVENENAYLRNGEQEFYVELLENPGEFREVGSIDLYGQDQHSLLLSDQIDIPDKPQERRRQLQWSLQNFFIKNFRAVSRKQSQSILLPRDDSDFIIIEKNEVPQHTHIPQNYGDIIRSLVEPSIEWKEARQEQERSSDFDGKDLSQMNLERQEFEFHKQTIGEVFPGQVSPYLSSSAHGTCLSYEDSNTDIGNQLKNQLYNNVDSLGCNESFHFEPKCNSDTFFFNHSKDVQMDPFSKGDQGSPLFDFNGYSSLNQGTSQEQATSQCDLFLHQNNASNLIDNDQDVTLNKSDSIHIQQQVGREQEYLRSKQLINNVNENDRVGLKNLAFSFPINLVEQKPYDPLHTPFQDSQVLQVREISDGMNRRVGSNGSLTCEESIVGSPSHVRNSLSVDGSVRSPQDSIAKTSEMIKWCIEESELSDLEYLDGGSYGQVFVGYWNHTKVAVKRLCSQNEPPCFGKEDDNDDVEEESFIREVQILMSVRHANIVLFYGAILSPWKSIVMEYVKYGSLYKLLHSSKNYHVKRSLPLRLKIAKEVAIGMNYLLYKGIWHLDLKTQNILLGEGYTAKICDFGLSRIGFLRKAFLSRGTFGTPQYTAPEVLRDYQHKKSEKADIFSFGMVLYEMVTLKRPWHKVEPASIIYLVTAEKKRLEIPKDVDEMIAGLIRWCWEEDPQKRPSFEVILNELEKICKKYPCIFGQRRSQTKIERRHSF